MKQEKIIRALRFCARDADEGGCKGCPLDHDHPYDTGCIMELATAAADEIEKLTDRCARYAEEIAVLQERSRWIPVTGRLPEIGEVVLAVANGQPRENATLVGAIELAEWYECGWLVEAWPDLNGTVTHWMPLPDGPEVE